MKLWLTALYSCSQANQFIIPCLCIVEYVLDYGICNELVSHGVSSMGISQLWSLIQAKLPEYYWLNTDKLLGKNILCQQISLLIYVFVPVIAELELYTWKFVYFKRSVLQLLEKNHTSEAAD